MKYTDLMTAPSAALPDGFPPKFRSQIQVDPTSKRYVSDFQLQRRSGYDKYPLNIPGALAYTARGPVGSM